MIKMYLNSIYICLKDVFNVIYYKYYFIKVINFESVVVGVKVEEDLVIGYVLLYLYKNMLMLFLLIMYLGFVIVVLFMY